MLNRAKIVTVELWIDVIVTLGVMIQKGGWRSEGGRGSGQTGSRTGIFRILKSLDLINYLSFSIVCLWKTRHREQLKQHRIRFRISYTFSIDLCGLYGGARPVALVMCGHL